MTMPGDGPSDGGTGRKGWTGGKG